MAKSAMLEGYPEPGFFNLGINILNQKVFCCVGAYRVHWRMFNSIRSLCSLDGISHSVVNQKCLADSAKCSLEEDIAPG